MEISKYWHKETRAAEDSYGHRYDLTCWGGSSQSAAEAKSRALGKIDRILFRLSGGEKLEEYEYACGQLREEVIEEIVGADGGLIGAVTRNRYGALVLNAATVLIADIDVPRPGLLDWLRSLFGRGPKKDKTYYLDQVYTFSGRNPEHSLTVYETHSGLRVFVTGEEYAPESEAAGIILELLHSDTLYRKLCLSQKCYRARLTPKPWRCGMDRPPNHFPRETAEQQGTFGRWLLEYTRRSRSHSVCKPMATLGPGTMTDTARRILKAHDAIAINREFEALA